MNLSKTLVVCRVMDHLMLIFFSNEHIIQWNLLQIDARILKAVAIEHPKDVNDAAAVVISEFIPLFYPNLVDDSSTTQSGDKTPVDAPDNKGTWIFSMNKIRFPIVLLLGLFCIPSLRLLVVYHV